MPLKPIRTTRTMTTSPSSPSHSVELPGSPPRVLSDSSMLHNVPMLSSSRHPPIRLLTGEPSDHCSVLAHTQPNLFRSTPPIIHAKSPYCPIPLPPQTDSSTPVSINPVLEFTQRPRINFDLSLPPSSITTSQCHERYLFEPATYPGLPSLSVISPLLPWAITVHASSINPALVTVADVLGTIYGAVHISVTEAEFVYLTSSSEAHARNEAYHDQEYGAQGLYRRDMIRVDFFGGKSRFSGLSRSSMGWDTWILNVE